MSRNGLNAASLAFLVLLAYAPAFRAGYVVDDEQYVYDNPTLRTPGGLRRIWLEPQASPQYYPLVFTSFWLEHRAWGLNAAGYHVTNILLHAANALLLWLALRRLGVPGAWLAAALFGLHPVHVESVAWVSERKNVLSGLFYGLALLAYLRFAPPEPDRPAPPGRWRWYTLAALLFLLALLSKTVTFSLPAVILLLLWWKRGKVTVRDAVPLAPLLIMGLVFVSVSVWMERSHGWRGADGSFTVPECCLLAGRAVWFYAGKLAWPAPLMLFYPHWHVDAGAAWQYLFPCAAFAVLPALWLLRGRVGRGPVAAALYFGGTLSPALSFFNLATNLNTYVADHYQYLASIGLLVPAAALAATAWQRFHVPGRAAAGVALLALGVLTWRQCHVYRTADTFYTDLLAKNPAAWVAHYNRGTGYLCQGRLDEAAADFAATLRLRPGCGWAYYNWGLALYQQGKPEEARRQFQAAVTVNPRLAYPHFVLGRLCTQDHDRAALALLLPRPPLDLAPLCVQKAKEAEALRHFGDALRAAPDFPDTYDELGKFLWRLGACEEAERLFDQARRLRRDRQGCRCSVLDAGP
jgi:tetratricopeptide (TPR) repeat protein